jgi:hypothetical protein
MAITTKIPELDDKGLRDFGLTTGTIVGVLFGLVLPWLFDAASFPLWPWIVFAVLAVWGLVAPRTLRTVYRVWMRFGLLISKVTTPLIMGLVFIVAIVPLALVLKLIRWDAMARTIDHESASYRVVSEKPADDSLKRPF